MEAEPKQVGRNWWVWAEYCQFCGARWFPLPIEPHHTWCEHPEIGPMKEYEEQESAS